MRTRDSSCSVGNRGRDLRGAHRFRGIGAPSYEVELYTGGQFVRSERAHACTAKVENQGFISTSSARSDLTEVMGTRERCFFSWLLAGTDQKKRTKTPTRGGDGDKAAGVLFPLRSRLDTNKHERESDRPQQDQHKTNTNRRANRRAEHRPPGRRPSRLRPRWSPSSPPVCP